MQRIALVGSTGVGKSTVGECLSTRLGAEFVDLDARIEQVSGMSIPELFRKLGEAAFRKYEEDELTAVTVRAEQQSVILATGGGVVVSGGNRHILRHAWKTIFLKAEVDTLVQRLSKHTRRRPLLANSVDLRTRITTLLERRQSWYDAVSCMCVSVDDKSIPEIVDEICLHLTDLGAVTDHN